MTSLASPIQPLPQPAVDSPQPLAATQTHPAPTAKPALGTDIAPHVIQCSAPAKAEPDTTPQGPLWPQLGPVRLSPGMTWERCRTILRRKMGEWTWRHDVCLASLADVADDRATLEQAAPPHRPLWQSIIWTALTLDLIRADLTAPKKTNSAGNGLNQASPQHNTPAPLPVVIPSLEPEALPLVAGLSNVPNLAIQLLDPRKVEAKHLDMPDRIGLPGYYLTERLDESVVKHLGASTSPGTTLEVACPTTASRHRDALWLLIGSPVVRPETYVESLNMAFFTRRSSGSHPAPGQEVTGPTVLPISIEDKSAWVGPPEIRGRQGCHLCHWLHRADATQQWSASIAGELDSTFSTSHKTTSLVCRFVCALTHARSQQHALRHCTQNCWDDSTVSLFPAHQVVELMATPAQVRAIISPPHPQCRCQRGNLGHT